MAQAVEEFSLGVAQQPLKMKLRIVGSLSIVRRLSQIIFPKGGGGGGGGGNEPSTITGLDWWTGLFD